jgi:crossover junction endodeoxyribonuclease RuvC
MSVTGTGAGSKEQVAFMVRRLLDVRGPLAPDASDALAVALCHHHRARRPEPARAASAAGQRLAALLARRRAR